MNSNDDNTSETVIIMDRRCLNTTYQQLMVILLFFICQSAFAESIKDRKTHEIGIGGGFRIIGHKISKFTNDTNPMYITAEYSKKVINTNLFTNISISLGGAGRLNSSNQGSEKELLLFFEPQIGFRYDFISLKFSDNFNAYPFVEFGVNHTNAKLENNTDYNLSETGDGFGFNSGIGIYVDLSQQVKLRAGLNYYHIPVKFDFVEDNMGGPAFYAKVVF